VPFILKAGKALDNRKAEIRVQFQETPHFLFPGQQAETMRNELVVRLQPDEAIYLKMIVKKPGRWGWVAGGRVGGGASSRPRMALGRRWVGGFVKQSQPPREDE